VRSMNFGQHWRTPNVAEVSYAVEIPLEFFVALLDEQLPSLVEDTRQFPDEESSLDRAIAAATFSNAVEALRDRVLANELAQFYAHEVLLRWLGDGPPDVEPGFVLNTIERVVIEPDAILLEGTGRRSGIPVVYQDV